MTTHKVHRICDYDFVHSGGSNYQLVAVDAVTKRQVVLVEVDGHSKVLNLADALEHLFTAISVEY